MPAGDPAGYLPNVVKKRLKTMGTKPYKARGKRRDGYVSPSAPQKRLPKGKSFRKPTLPKPGDQGARGYFGRGR